MIPTKTSSFYRFTVLPALLAIFVACRSIEPMAPSETVKTIPSLPQPTSQIIIPLEIALSGYYDLADKQVPKEFSGGEHPCEGVSFDYHFVRNPLKLNADDNKVTVDVGGKYWIKMSYCVDCSDLLTDKPSCILPRIPFSCGVGEPMRRMQMQYTSSFSLTEDYGIETETKLTKLEALDPCTVTVFKFDATDQLLTEVRKALKDVAKDIDKQMSEISFKKEAKEAWDQASETFRIPGYGYVHLNPQKIALLEPQIKENILYTTMLVEALPVFDHNSEQSPKTELPDLEIMKSLPSDTFQLYVDFNLNYDSLSTTIQQFGGGQKIMIKDKEVIFDSIAITGASANELLLRVRFSGAKKGTLYLHGTPVFNSETETIELTNLAYDLETKSVLLKTAKWLFSDRIIEEMTKASKQNLQPYLVKLTKTLNQSLEYNFDEYKLNGTIKNLHVMHLYPAEDQLVVRVKATGNLKLKNN